MSYRIGLGDWFAPDCQPGSAGCVPHWYCYVPGMATPDCLASLTTGLEVIGSDVGAAVGGTAAAVGSGVVSAVGSTATGAASSFASGLSPTVLVGGAVIVGVLLLMWVAKS